MKKVLSAALGVMLLSTATVQLKAQSLESSLDEACTQLTSATTNAAMMAANNQFDMIAAKWPGEWAANYYNAYAKAYIAGKETDAARKDQLLDQADKYVTAMNNLNAQDDESLVLTAYVAFSRFMVDPANRWKKYLEIMDTNLDKAKKTDPDNPRIYYLQGIPIFNKPVLYGGGKKKARPYFEKASMLFEKQARGSILKPGWGEKDNADYLSKCGK
jgi:hypothetical protein